MKNPIPKKNSDRFIPFTYPTKEKVVLSKPSDHKTANFLDIIFSRRSSSDFSKIELNELSKLLYYTTSISNIEIDEDGFILSKRTVPSAGARHPIDLLISLPNLSAKRGLSYYNPIDHSLNNLNIERKKLDCFLLDVGKCLPIKNACIIWFSIQTKKTSSKYHNAESLYWRDAGALLYCIQIISTFLNLKSCPIGTLAFDSFKNLFASKKLLSGGGVLIGK